jgi:hypothetical protein
MFFMLVYTGEKVRSNIGPVDRADHSYRRGLLEC